MMIIMLIIRAYLKPY